MFRDRCEDRKVPPAGLTLSFLSSLYGAGCLTSCSIQVDTSTTTFVYLHRFTYLSLTRCIFINMTFARILYALTFAALSITYSTSFAFAIPVESWSIAKWPAVDPQSPLHIALESRSDLERDSSLSGEAASHLMRRAHGQNEQHTGQYGTSGYHPQPQANLRGPDHAAVTRRPPQPPSSWGSHATGQQFPDPHMSAEKGGLSPRKKSYQ
ncbi:hypothetical protein K474DRAFT_1776975 [Panus rudis PR-1116 ss-1]|nr:hypothetical protein K474DRAFT_1776975 [Panus rudis PR-1116 ss-1]